MKLHRIVAENNQKAMMKIRDLLGSDAVIFSTKTVANGVEMLASATTDAFQQNTYEMIEETSGNHLALEKLENKMEKLQEYVRKIYSCIGYNFTIGGIVNEDEPKYVLTQALAKMGFSYQTSNDLIYHYMKSLDASKDTIDVQDLLLKVIKTKSIEEDSHKKIIALIGPSGVGKTTTLVKLVKRMLEKVSPDQIGIITSDESDISESNLLGFHARKFGIAIEYASHSKELFDTIQAMSYKKYIYIDTQGLGVKDQEKLEKLKQLLGFKQNDFYSLIVLPCNYQENVLDEFINKFRLKNTIGCVLTKQDEALSMAQAISTSIKFTLPICYVCNGKDIENDIYIPKSKYLAETLKVTADECVDHENNLIMNWGMLSN